MDIELRDCEENDVQTLFAWRNLPDIVRLSSSGQPVSWDEHRNWFETVMSAAEKKRIFIVMNAGRDIGMVRFDRDRGEVARISAYLQPAETGHGYGPAAISQAVTRISVTWPDLKTIEAMVLVENEHGKTGFIKAGFSPSREQQAAGHTVLVRTRSDAVS